MLKKLWEIEALRGFAALYVVIHHCKIGEGTWLQYITMQGQVAVMLFFIVSGFVIYYSIQRTKNISFKKYFKKRLIRIYPVFIVALLISYLALSYNYREWLDPNWKQLFVNLINFQDLDRHPGIIDIGYFSNVPLWSLSYEWWFYMLFFPIYKYVKESWQEYIVLGLSIIGMTSYIIYPNMISIILWYFIMWWWGVVLAKKYINSKNIELKDLRFIGLSFLVCILPMSVIAFMQDVPLNFSYHPVIQIRHFIYSFGIITLGWIWYKYKLVGFNKLFKSFQIFAPVSYAIYVFHFPLLINMQFCESTLLHHIIAISVTFILAYLVERKLYPYVYKIF